ncbi:MAG: hypothetical protein K0M49_05820 [Arenimonas sp.]|nr:hypothetical protein [Rhizobium sp.]MBW8445127.1 hypothetical protein [Arenimonas sp.]
MAKTDHSELERAREERHESVWRVIGTLNLSYCCERGMRPFCRNRSCLRDRLCSGPMVATPRQGPAIARERELGLSGAAVACLPVCVINMETNVVDHLVATTLPQIDAFASEEDRLAIEYYSRKPNRAWRRYLARLARDHPDP